MSAMTRTNCAAFVTHSLSIFPPWRSLRKVSSTDQDRCPFSSTATIGYSPAAIVPAASEHAVPDIEIPAEHRLGPVEGAPILFGHHWFSGTVKVESHKVACLDWSAAKGGPLVAYRWNGESELTDDRLVAAGA